MNIFLIVLVYDGNSAHVANACRKIGLFRENISFFVTALDLIRCFKQIK